MHCMFEAGCFSPVWALPRAARPRAQCVMISQLETVRISCETSGPSVSCSLILSLAAHALTGRRRIESTFCANSSTTDHKLFALGMMAEEASSTPLDMSFLDTVPHTYRLLASGGVAGCVAKTMTAPLSRLTILFQVNSAVINSGRPQYANGVMPAVKKVLREEGFLAFWKGNGTSVLHRFPYAAINFYCYEKIKESLGRPETPLSRLTAGACAGAVACSLCYPLDLIRTRLTMQDGHKHYRSIGHAFYKIARNEGLRGLYRGLATTLGVAVPNLAISYCIYGSMKELLWSSRYPNKPIEEASEHEPYFWESMICGAASGICSSVVTFPMDVLRRRLQVLGLHRPGLGEVGPLRESRYILKHEGLRGLYRGLAPELLKVMPMVGATFATYELMKDVLGV